MKKIWKFVIAIIIAILTILITSYMILNQARFGQLPRGERLERIKKSANYRDGEFKNQSITPVMTSDKSRFQIMMDFLFKKKVRNKPEGKIPVIKTDIKSLNPNENILIWFGHSSYFIQINGKTFLVDPVFSDYASPFSFINKAFAITDNYSAKDFKSIDCLLITHDHWDHLDYQTILDLKPKVKNIICGLGVGQHFEYWGFEKSVIRELDWYESVIPYTGWQIFATPTRHFSGRGLKGNQTLWVSFVLKSPDFNFYLSGDGGYDNHFTEIGKNYGPFNMAILEQGQYNDNWNLIHLMPDKAFIAAEDLNANRIMPVHNSKFALADHPWDEPMNMISGNNKDSAISVVTPQIGEVVNLDDTNQVFKKWWKGIN